MNHLVRLFSALGAAALLVSCSDSDSDSAPPPSRVSTDIGPAGGTLAVTSGDLAGFRLVVPQGALASNETLTVESGDVTAIDGLVPVSAVARMTPPGLTFALPATATLPLRTTQVPAGRTGAEVVVALRDEARGTLATFTPASVDLAGGELTLPIARLGALWAAVPAAGRVLLGEYLPYLDAVDFEFDDGSRLTIATATDVPNVAGPVAVVTRTGATATEGEYWRRSADGALEWLGAFDETEDEQAVASGPVRWIPTAPGTGNVADNTYDLLVYSPIGATQPTTTRSRRTTLEVVAVEVPVTTAAGTFGDCVELLWTTTGTGTPESTLRVWLASGVGPVQYSVDGGTPARFAFGTIDGTQVVVD